MAATVQTNPRTQGKPSRGPMWRRLRAQLILRTLVPLSLLVAAFAVVGQVGYTQVSESLAKSRDSELAAVEAARVADYLSQSVQALQEVANSSVLLTGEQLQIFYTLRNEPLTQHFDLVQVTDPTGRVVATSRANSGNSVLNTRAFQALQEPGLTMIFEPANLRDGRRALVLSMSYIGTQGEFAGVVEGAIALGSTKLGQPLSDDPAVLRSPAAEQQRAGFSYLVAGDGTILWHPDSNKVGTGSFIGSLPPEATRSPGAQITAIDGERTLVGYAPLNLGLLLPRTVVQPAEWVRWYVVHQEAWASIVAPINSFLGSLLLFAVVLFLAAVVLVARQAGTMTRPVAQLVGAAQELSAGRLRHRLQIEGPQEIEELAHQFNVMAEQLESSYSDLENKVAERTQALATANAVLERRLLESQSMQIVAANMVGTAELEQILHTIATSATEVLDAEGSVVFLRAEDNNDELVAGAVWNLPGVPTGKRVSIDSSLSGRAVRTAEPQTSVSTIGDERVSDELQARTNARNLLVVPLVSRGVTTGAITIVNKRTGEFTDDDLRQLILLASQAAVAIERAQLFSDSQRQLKVLKTVNELALSVTLSRSIEQTLLDGIEHIASLLSARGSVVFLYSEKTKTLNYAVSYNLTPAHEALVRRASHDVFLSRDPGARKIAVQEAFVSQAPYIVENMRDADYYDPWSRYLRDNGADAIPKIDSLGDLGALIALPLTVRDKRLGTIALYFPEPRTFDLADVQLYQSFAKILALAVYNSQLLTQTSKLATVEERARLARELHDSVTQSLFSLNLTLRAARRVLSVDPVQATQLIDNVHELAQGSLAEMRALIFELRPQALENEGLALALQKHADAVRARSGLSVHLEITGDRRLPIDHEEALYQIAREALHNVVKHAQATDAWVKLDLSMDDIVLSIRDNGRGFDPVVLREGGSRIGTSTMRERAEANGGSLEIVSEAGYGTEVIAHVSVQSTSEQRETERRSVELASVEPA